jgi:aspartyl-tRNA(Asn)/glutamyl-tRNA(Gln) amidotransferase subunit A
MAAADLCDLGIAELGRRYRGRELSPVDVTTAHLTRIERLDKTLNSYVTVTAEHALADARAAEAAIRHGTAGPLAGIPIAYKDLYATRGVLTTGGSALLADWIPDHGATGVTRLSQAGMVMLGKLITHEFAFGIQFPGHRFLPARNPWNLEHIPGGSSSGSGAALAAGLTVGALGSDTGGSIRGPAAFCGIVGLKPTYGRVSRAGVLTLSWTLDHTGPMARSVEDCAFMLQALAGRPGDPRRAGRAGYAAGLTGGVRRAAHRCAARLFFHDVKPEWRRRSSRPCRRCGARRRRPRGDHPEHLVVAAFIVIMLTEAFAYHARDLRERPQLYGEVLREKLLAGALFTAEEYVQAQRLRARLCEDVNQVLGEVDLLATPTTLVTAPSFSTTSLPVR